MRNGIRTPQSGVTLIELLVTLVVLAVSLAIAIPSYQNAVASSRIASQSGELLGAAQYARTEAIKRNTRVTLCKSTDSQACATTGGWDEGWIVFVDSLNPGVVDAGETVLNARGALKGTSITSTGGVADMVSYLPSGRARGPGGAMQSGAIAVCGPASAGATGRVVTIEAGTGRPSVADAVCP